ncbi:hypothetical protein [Roseovarius indicus]|uniref:hypothetical protein n=1 Tax=Roseovarius indicus TaxID=540747 RepID=UPI0032EF2F8B
MYEKLASGYATKFVQEHPDLGVVTTWMGSPKSRDAVSAFRSSVLSKKPGRVASRLSKLVRPAFKSVQVAQWDKSMKAVFAVRLLSSDETDVLDINIDERKFFSERSVVLSDLVFTARSGECSEQLSVSANISHHALSRLLERGAATPETLKTDVLEVLQQVRALRNLLSLGINHGLTKINDETTYDIILPYKKGGLVVRTVRIGAEKRSFFSSPLPVFSIRTYLDETKLRAREHERMAGFRLSRASMLSREDVEYTLAWLQGNAEETLASRRFDLP